MRKSNAVAAIALTICGFAAYISAQRTPTPKTCWGWIKGHMEVEGGTVKAIRGRVVDPSGEGVVGALIEVFAYNDVDLDKRTRVAYRFVDLNGNFFFDGLRPGKYELRGSFCHGFDAGHTIVILRPNKKSASSKRILVKLNISQ